MTACVCGFEMDVRASLDVFEQNPHCGRVCTPVRNRSIPSHVWQCGLSASEGDMKMQEELAALMTQRLRLDNNASYHMEPKSPPTPPQTDAQSQLTYITQHYHHSAHQAAPTPPAQQASVNEELARHGIDASVLTPSQISLFRQAQPEQQFRLIQLWSIAPIRCGIQLLPKDLVKWPQTSMQQEEEAAQSRYMQIQVSSGNCSPEQPLNAEPYIVRGYDISPDVSTTTTPSNLIPRMKEYNQALDPAYQSREWRVHDSQPIEHPYGVGQQMWHFTDQDEVMS